MYDPPLTVPEKSPLIGLVFPEKRVIKIPSLISLRSSFLDAVPGLTTRFVVPIPGSERYPPEALPVEVLRSFREV